MTDINHVIYIHICDASYTICIFINLTVYHSLCVYYIYIYTHRRYRDMWFSYIVRVSSRHPACYCPRLLFGHRPKVQHAEAASQQAEEQAVKCLRSAAKQALFLGDPFFSPRIMGSLWLCQNSYWDFHHRNSESSENGEFFHSYVKSRWWKVKVG